jgi:hypothetical protein
MLEYNHGRPCALVEYKHINAQKVNPGHATYRALVALADGYSEGALPCFVARYDPADWSFRITPLNESARAHYSHCLEDVLTEQRFVQSLYLLRKKVLTAEDMKVIKALSNTVSCTDVGDGETQQEQAFDLPLFSY